MSLIHKPASSKSFQRYLQPGERIQWVGRPGLKKRESLLPRKDMWIGIAWCIIGVAMTVYVMPDAKQHGGFKLFLYWLFGIGSKTQWTRDERDIGIAYQFFFIVGISILIYGLVLIFLSVVGALPIQPTRYALTDRRILFIHGLPNSKFAAYDLRDITPEITSENIDGSGSLALKGPEIDIGDIIKSLPADILEKLPKSNLEQAYSTKIPPSFMNIPDVRVVRDLIAQLKMQLPARS